MVSIIIPIFCDMKNPFEFHERLRNLNEVLYCMNNQTYNEKEIIIVEQYSDFPVLDHIIDKKRYRYIPIQHKIFNQSWCRNVGAVSSKGNFVLQYSGDCIVDNDYVERIRKSYENDYVFGWSRIRCLNYEGTNKYLRTRKYIRVVNTTEIISEGGIILSSGPNGGACLYNKNFFLNKIGGYNESFFEWGLEDNEMLMRTYNVSGKWRGIEYTILHLHHGGRLVEGINNRGNWEETHMFPGLVSSAIVNNMGKLSGPTLIDFNELLHLQ